MRSGSSNSRNLWSRVTRWLLAGVLLIITAAVVVEAKAWFAFANEKQSLTGVRNFGRVETRLYRGGQPSDAGFVALKNLGIDIVVSFTIGDTGTAAERRRVESLGMAFVNLPWSAIHTPSHEEVAAFLELLRSHSDKTIFVHCWQGVDRTGVMIALFRIAFDHWTAAQALDEMRAFHYHYIFQPHLLRYVEQFALGRD